MKTSIQKQFDILLVAAQTGCSKLEAVAASKGWGFKTTSAEKAEEIKAAVKAVAVKTTTVDLTEQVREVKAQSRAKAVAVQSYIKALSVATKATAKVREVKSKTVGWSVDLLKAMSKDAQAKVALEAAKAAL